MHPSSTFSPSGVGHRACQNSVIGLGLMIMIVMKIEMVSDNGLMTNVNDDGDDECNEVIA